MAQKRPFDDEVANEVSSKHPRQDGPSDEIISCNDSGPIEYGPDKPYDSGEASIQNNELESREEHVNGSFPEVPREDIGDMETEVARSASLSHWATSSTSDDDEPQELVHVPFFPGYFSFDRPVRSVINPDDVYYCLLDYPPRKRVLVGPEYQAEIPELDSLVKHSALDGLAAGDPKATVRNSTVNDDEQLEGICIMPSPETEPPGYDGEKVGDGRTDCSCPDQGSIRCVRQHIAEAREKLMRNLGQDTFTELGFYDMGEVVAEKWSEEEEQLFHEVVYSNPASLGRNFWNALSAVFPSRTKMEIVSYYFNVFMLRKRAAQNRCDPFNIDSDNDEWQGSDDDGGDEDEDSGVESPVRHDGFEFHQNGLHGQQHEHEHEDDENGDLSDEAREIDDRDDVSFVRKSDPDSTSELLGKKLNDDGGENEAHDGSCTSSDSGASEQGAQLKPDGCQEWHEYILDPSDAKAWDGYNMSCPKSNIDFLPTCSMIEEVFGDADFDSNLKRW